MRAEDERTRTKASLFSLRPLLLVLPLFLMSVEPDFACSSEEESLHDPDVVSEADSTGDGGEGDSSVELRETGEDSGVGTPKGLGDGEEAASSADSSRDADKKKSEEIHYVTGKAFPELSKLSLENPAVDLDGDGIPDVLLAEKNGGTVRTFLRNGRPFSVFERDEKGREVQDLSEFNAGGVPSSVTKYVYTESATERYEYRRQPGRADFYFLEKWTFDNKGYRMTKETSRFLDGEWKVKNTEVMDGMESFVCYFGRDRPD